MGTLESKVEVQINDAIGSLKTLIGGLDELKTSLNDTFGATKNNNLKGNIEDSSKALKTMSTIKKALNFAGIAYSLKKGLNFAKNIVSANIDMIETNNLFEVSMGKVVDQYGKLDEAQSKYYLQGMKFQEEMNEKLATNKKELMEYQSMYFNLFNSQLGAKNKDKSYFMSEQLTKAGYDIASLYNIPVEQAMNKIKSGIAGQVESLRTIGIDVSESSLTSVIRNVGITDRNVQQLSYAEKEVARYIAIVEQAKVAQGDFARTFDSPANQIKIFKNQLAELQQVAGAFITNVFGNILVYVNAIIMVVKEILKSFANLFGYDLNTGGADLSTAVGVDNLSSGLGSASKKAKELKKQLMGFDEINNIDPASQSSGSSGGGASVGIDDKLLNSLKEWDNMMGNISGKAREIRDKMLEWLGFHRNDKGGWELNEGLTNFEKILDVVKAIGVAILGWKVSKAITGILNGLGILNKTQAFQIAFGLTLALTGIFAQYKGTQHLLDGDIDLFTILETLFGTAGGALGIATILKSIKFGKELSLGNRLKIGLGIMLTLQSLQVIVDGTKNNDIRKQIIGALEGGLAGTMLISSGKGLKFGLKAGLLITVALLEIEMAVNIVKWWNEYFEEEKTRIYKNKKELNLGEMIYVGLSSIGTGINKNIIEPIFGEDALRPIIDWTANVIIEFNKLGKNIENWWVNDVSPWFTKEKWQKLGDNIKNALTNKWNEFKDWWGNTALVQWWNNNVTPWFTEEKWQETANNAKEGIETKFNELKEKFKPIEEWWNSKIAPWFTIEKWKEVANNAKTGIEDKFNEWKNNFKPIENWWNDKVKPWFTLEKWKELGRDAVKGIQDIFSNFNFKIKLPHFTWTSTPASGWIANVLSALNLPTSLPKLNVSWYAKGGMPDMGEIFVAREKGPEMVGRIGNKSTVANNDQIVTAIRQGVYEAVTSAMANGSNEVHLNIRTDEGVIVKKASEGFKDYVMQTGELPFPIPT